MRLQRKSAQSALPRKKYYPNVKEICFISADDMALPSRKKRWFQPSSVFWLQMIVSPKKEIRKGDILEIPWMKTIPVATSDELSEAHHSKAKNNPLFPQELKELCSRKSSYFHLNHLPLVSKVFALQENYSSGALCFSGQSVRNLGPKSLRPSSSG
jgi:hypothetical protein